MWLLGAFVEQIRAKPLYLVSAFFRADSIARLLCQSETRSRTAA